MRTRTQETAKLLWCPVQVHGALPCVAQAYELIAAVVDGALHAASAGHPSGTLLTRCRCVADVDDVVLDVVPCHDARTPTAAVLQRCREISASTGVRISFPGVHTRLSVLVRSAAVCRLRRHALACADRAAAAAGGQHARRVGRSAAAGGALSVLQANFTINA